MAEGSENGFPRARTADLVTERIGDELVVYDEVTSEAHCLRPLAAIVFDMADGERSTAELAALATAKLNEDFEAVHVEMALAELEDRGLVLAADGEGISRRQLMRRGAAVGGAAFAAALVTSAVAPAYGMANSLTTMANPPSTIAVRLVCGSTAYDVGWGQNSNHQLILGAPDTCGTGPAGTSGPGYKAGNCSYQLSQANMASGCPTSPDDVSLKIDPSGTAVQIYYNSTDCTLVDYVYKCGNPSCFSQSTNLPASSKNQEDTVSQGNPTFHAGYAVIDIQCA